MTFRRFMLAALLACLSIFPRPAESEEGEGLDALLEKRTAVLWIEGEAIGEMILGAKAQMAFIYADGRLTEAVWKDPAAPEWLRENTGFFGSRETKKKALFIVRVKTNRNFTLEPSMVSIGTHVLTPGDILTSKGFAPFGDLPPDLTGTFAAVIPLSAVKGKTISLSCGDFKTELVLP